MLPYSPISNLNKEAWAAMPRLYVKVVGKPLSEEVE